MARRGGGGFKVQAPKQATLGISVILWLLGLLNGLAVIHLPNNLGFWSFVVGGGLLILGCLIDGL